MDNVMIVEDEQDILKLISENLRVRGFQVSQANTGRLALERLHENHPSLLVLDIKLPDFTGWELLKKIENDPTIHKDFPILIMTASITDANMDLTLYPNVVQILIKPFSTVKLVAAVRQTLTSYATKE